MSTLSNGTEIVDYTFDQITNPVLMKTSAKTGKITWAKRFLLNSEPNSKDKFYLM